MAFTDLPEYKEIIDRLNRIEKKLAITIEDFDGTKTPPPAPVDDSQPLGLLSRGRKKT